ncbi:MAG: HlyD family efflux transporter periplasmic adaptor subunit [Armatimonadetes bacterium]|nr:HlyD family efflux transporter periplasmic adaptor subunit [Armatimonadota bacterium]
MSATTRPGMRRRPGGPDQTRARRRPWWHYIIVFFILLSLAGVARGGYAIWFSLTHVRAVPAKVTGLVVNVAAKTDTRVQEVLVRTGDEVKKGQVVVRLDSADLEARVGQAQAFLEAQKSALKSAESELELTIRQTAATVHEAEAQLQAAKARLAQAQAEKEMQLRQQPDEVRRAEAGVASAKSELNDAQANLRRMEKLHGEGATSQLQLDTARTRSQVAQSAVDAAEAALAVARTQDHQSQIRNQQVATRAAEERQALAGLESAETTGSLVALREQDVLAKQATVAEAEAALEASQVGLSDAVLRSPIDGVVIKGPTYSVKDGEVVLQGQPIVTLVSTEVPLWISASVSELYTNRVQEGQPVLVRIDAFRGRWFDGTVDKLGRATEISTDQSSPYMTQRVPLSIKVDTEGMNVKHGMTCRVWIDVRNR